MKEKLVKPPHSKPRFPLRVKIQSSNPDTSCCPTTSADSRPPAPDQVLPWNTSPQRSQWLTSAVKRRVWCMLRSCLLTAPQLAQYSVAMRVFVDYVCDCFWTCLIFFGERIHPNGNIYSSAHVSNMAGDYRDGSWSNYLFFSLEN